jgi:hypothetical protein
MGIESSANVALCFHELALFAVISDSQGAVFCAVEPS